MRENYCMKSKRKTIVGVMGPGAGCTEELSVLAYELGARIAAEGWVVLSGGRDFGVMDAVSRGAKSKNGTTIGILPNKEASVSDAVDFAIITDVNLARNNINVVTSDIIVACGMGIGTASEIALALNAGKQVVMIGSAEGAVNFFAGLSPSLIHGARSVDEAIELVRGAL